MAQTDTLAWIVSLGLLLLNLFQMWYIPRRTERMVILAIKNIDPEKLAPYTREVGKLIIPELAKRIKLNSVNKALKKAMKDVNLEDIVKTFQKSAQKAAMGRRSGDAKRLAGMRQAMYMDLVKSTKLGQFLAMFPEFNKHMRDNPEDLETFVVHWLPRLQAGQMYQQMTVQNLLQEDQESQLRARQNANVSNLLSRA